MARFYNDGEQMVRPGVYARYINIGGPGSTVNVVPPLPPSSDGDSGDVIRLSVSPDGVLMATGQGFSLGSGGHTVIFAAAIDDRVIGETIVVTNPPS